FLLLDRGDHKCRNRFARETETHLGSGTFAASIGRVFSLGETWRAGDCPVEPAALNHFFHGKRIAPVISKDKTDNAIGNSREVCCSRENNDPFHSRSMHCMSRRNSTILKKRAWLEWFSRSKSGNDRVVIFHYIKELVFVHRVSLEDSNALIF